MDIQKLKYRLEQLAKYEKDTMPDELRFDLNVYQAALRCHEAEEAAEEYASLAGKNASRAQKAEAQLAELAKQKPHHFAVFEPERFGEGSGWKSCHPDFEGAEPFYSRAAPPATNAAAEVARAALDYIDALPSDVVASLPAMPGFDRDWAENALSLTAVPPAPFVVKRPKLTKADDFYTESERLIFESAIDEFAENVIKAGGSVTDE